MTTNSLKLEKVHIALLTNLTEGEVENEHMTMYFNRHVNASTVIKHMERINSLLPMELAPMFTGRIDAFRSWSGDLILTPETNHARWEPPFVALLEGVSKPHITLAINPDQSGEGKIWQGSQLNWDHGLLVGECHAGFKVEADGEKEMKYFTVEELKEWAE